MTTGPTLIHAVPSQIAAAYEAVSIAMSGTASCDFEDGLLRLIVKIPGRSAIRTVEIWERTATAGAVDTSMTGDAVAARLADWAAQLQPEDATVVVQAAQELEASRRSVVAKAVFADFAADWTDAIIRPGTPTQPPAVGVHTLGGALIRYHATPDDHSKEMSSEMTDFLTDVRLRHFIGHVAGTMLHVAVRPAPPVRVKNDFDPKVRLRLEHPTVARLRLGSDSRVP